ncbi:hypothetical protein [Micromonospora sp. NPDC050200]|uniref:hypothetical protein n=1 Tax=Micromonospora sp. NPDC050200 TaxID=3155664 RepID=UPI003404C283
MLRQLGELLLEGIAHRVVACGEHRQQSGGARHTAQQLLASATTCSSSAFGASYGTARSSTSAGRWLIMTSG